MSGEESLVNPRDFLTVAGRESSKNIPPLSPEGFAAETGVSRETLSRLMVFSDLLTKWQKAVNLISPDDLADIWRRHILDSAQLLEYLPPNPRDRKRIIVDLGSGAGFPGLILAIMGAGKVHLVERDQKKCAFLIEAARLTGAAVEIHNRGIEELSDIEQTIRADVVIARGLAPLPKLLKYAAPLLRKGGVCLFLKGQKVEEELTAASKEWNMRIERLPSRTSGSGVILRLGDLAHGPTERSAEH